jgi:hypothetical protein
MISYLNLDLFFQVITLAESYSKLVSNLFSIARDSTINIRNLSSEFTLAFNGLNDFLNDLRSGKDDQPTIETNNLPNRDTAIAYIFQCLHSNTYSNAIKYLRSARYKNNEIGKFNFSFCFIFKITLAR